MEHKVKPIANLEEAEAYIADKSNVRLSTFSFATKLHNVETAYHEAILSYFLKSSFYSPFLSRILSKILEENGINLTVDIDQYSVISEYPVKDSFTQKKYQLDIICFDKKNESPYVFELKTKTNDSKDQLDSYYQIIKEKYSANPICFYITQTGEKPKKLVSKKAHHWICFSYQELVEKLEKALDGVETSKIPEIDKLVYTEYRDTISLLPILKAEHENSNANETDRRIMLSYYFAFFKAVHKELDSDYSINLYLEINGKKYWDNEIDDEIKDMEEKKTKWEEPIFLGIETCPKIIESHTPKAETLSAINKYNLRLTMERRFESPDFIPEVKNESICRDGLIYGIRCSHKLQKELPKQSESVIKEIMPLLVHILAKNKKDKKEFYFHRTVRKELSNIEEIKQYCDIIREGRKEKIVNSEYWIFQQVLNVWLMPYLDQKILISSWSTPHDIAQYFIEDWHPILPNR